jgi:hypothetical protein
VCTGETSFRGIDGVPKKNEIEFDPRYVVNALRLLVNALPPLPGRLLDLDNPGGSARSSLATGYLLLHAYLGDIVSRYRGVPSKRMSSNSIRDTW